MEEEPKSKSTHNNNRISRKPPSSQVHPLPFSSCSSFPVTVKVASDEEVLQNQNNDGKVVEEGEGRERLKRQREEVAKQVLIPEKWGQEQLMKDWTDYTTFDALLPPHRLIVTARDALIADVRKARSQRLRIQSSC